MKIEKYTALRQNNLKEMAKRPDSSEPPKLSQEHINFSGPIKKAID